MSFSWVAWDYGFLGISPQSEVNFHYILSEVHAMNMTHRCWCWSPDRHSVCQESHCKVALFALPRLSSLDVSHYAQPTLQEWGDRLCPLRVDFLQKLFEIFWMGDPSVLLPLIYLFNHFITSVWTHIDFKLWVIIPYYFLFLLELFQLWPLGMLSVGFCVSLMCPHDYCCFPALS